MNPSTCVAVVALAGGDLRASLQRQFTVVVPLVTETQIRKSFGSGLAFRAATAQVALVLEGEVAEGKQHCTPIIVEVGGFVCFQTHFTF